MSGEAPKSFVSVAELIDDFVALEREAWLAKHAASLLLVDNPGEDAENASFQTISSVEPGSPQEKLLSRLGTGRWAFVMRTDANKFASMLTVGRAAGSGMRLNVPSVSKFHAYLTHVARDACWYLADANSSNGTFVDGEELPPSHGKLQLRSGAMLRFGPDVTAQYYDSAGLWQLLNERLGETPEGGSAGTPPDGGSGRGAGASNT